MPAALGTTSNVYVIVPDVLYSAKCVDEGENDIVIVIDVVTDYSQSSRDFFCDTC